VKLEIFKSFRCSFSQNDLSHFLNLNLETFFKTAFSSCSDLTITSFHVDENHIYYHFEVLFLKMLFAVIAWLDLG